jgi:hypothetical protein
MYDARGQLYRVGYGAMMPIYDPPTPSAVTRIYYDLIAGAVTLDCWIGDSPDMKARGSYNLIAPPDERFWTPEAIAGKGIR